MRQLIWKQWHEQAWKLVLSCIVLSAFAAIGLHTRIIADQQMLNWVCWPFAMLLPLFATSGLVPSERGDGSFEAMKALPIGMRKLMAVEALTGVILCAAPLMMAMMVSIVIAGQREMSTAAMAEMFFRTVLTALALFVWFFAVTIRLPTDARAAMVAIGILMCWGMLSVMLGIPELRNMSVISPMSFLINSPLTGDSSEKVPSLMINLIVETAIACVLLHLAQRALGRDVRAGD